MITAREHELAEQLNALLELCVANARRIDCLVESSNGVQRSLIALRRDFEANHAGFGTFAGRLRWLLTGKAQ